ncbi:uncharacterized protein LOC127082136 [Lathyrus oleraceus]|uniref:uncharacterized protein LOC127082136 n=1 Tax=Pisum sativum TaxID=3888 RepID=UPI0021CE4EA7|nr:uncharacterized protein LOC127082136 [Pisum sativum]
MSKKIKDEVQKQFDAGFLAVTSYPLWVANIVLVPKKDNKMGSLVIIRSKWLWTIREDDVYHALGNLFLQVYESKNIKSSTVADHLAHQPIEDYQSMKFEFPDEDVLFLKEYYNRPDPNEGPEPGSQWTLVFDGASTALGSGVGAVITSSTGFYIPFTTIICFDYTNNMVEYKACIYGIERSIDLRIKYLNIYGDSTLVISQIKGELETRHPNLIPYREHVLKLIPYFEEITFDHIPREENHLEDTLATLASMFEVKWANEAPSISIMRLDEPTFFYTNDEVRDDKPWFYDIKRYLEKQEYLEDASILDKKTLRKLPTRFFLNGNVLYKRNHDSFFLRCVDRHEA